MVMSAVRKIALCVGPPPAIRWHCRHQHWRVEIGSPVIASVTAPQPHRPP
jgi:hypothetical protein